MLMVNTDMKKGVILDMDGTLWDSSEGVAKAWDAQAKAFGHPEVTITRDDIIGVMGNPMDVVAEKLFPMILGDERAKLQKACEEYENQYLREHGGNLYPEVIETFKNLREDGYFLYIVSNCQSGYIEAFLEFYNIPYGTDDDLISDIECFGNNLLSKGENICLVVERNNLDRAVYVGDIQSDYDSTCEAGIPFIHAKYGFGEIDAEVPAINEFKELSTVIKEVI